MEFFQPDAHCFGEPDLHWAQIDALQVHNFRRASAKFSSNPRHHSWPGRDRHRWKRACVSVTCTTLTRLVTQGTLSQTDPKFLEQAPTMIDNPPLHAAIDCRRWILFNRAHWTEFAVKLESLSGQIAVLQAAGPRVISRRGSSESWLVLIRSPESCDFKRLCSRGNRLAFVVAPYRPDTASRFDFRAMNSLGARYPSALCG